VTTDTRTDRPQTPEAAGELRQQLRDLGWRSDLGWVSVGSGSAQAAVKAADGADARRTIAYFPAIRALDGGALRLWRDGDVPVPPEADAREVMVATADGFDWLSEVLEAPATTVDDERETGPDPAGGGLAA
jgi:hypothetical protein